LPDNSDGTDDPNRLDDLDVLEDQDEPDNLDETDYPDEPDGLDRLLIWTGPTTQMGPTIQMA